MMKLLKICFFIIIAIAVLGIGLYFIVLNNNFETVERSELQRSSSNIAKVEPLSEYDLKKSVLLKLLNRKIDYSAVDLITVFPHKEGFKWHFSGPADYGKNMEIKNVVNEEGKIIISIKGSLDNESDGEAGNTDFEYNYVLTNESIEDSINGIILKNPLIIGNSWNHLYILNRKAYEMTTKITELKGEFITTESVISGIPNYTNGEYWRKDIYQLGKGLVYYAETAEEDYGGGIFDYKEDSIIEIVSEFETNY